MDPKSLVSLSDHLEALSKDGDPLEVLQEAVDFEYFRAWLAEGLGYGGMAVGGRASSPAGRQHRQYQFRGLG